jgi:hypothetical protein
VPAVIVPERPDPSALGAMLTCIGPEAAVDGTQATTGGTEAFTFNELMRKTIAAGKFDFMDCLIVESLPVVQSF